MEGPCETYCDFACNRFLSILILHNSAGQIHISQLHWEYEREKTNIYNDIDDFKQKKHNSSAVAMEFDLFWIKSLMLCSILESYSQLPQ